MDIAAQGILLTDKVLEHTRRLASPIAAGAPIQPGGQVGAVEGAIQNLLMAAGDPGDGGPSPEEINRQLTYFEKLLEQPLVMELELHEDEENKNEPRPSLMNRISPRLSFIADALNPATATAVGAQARTRLTQSEKNPEEDSRFMIGDDEEEENVHNEHQEHHEEKGLLTNLSDARRTGKLFLRGEKDWQEVSVSLTSSAVLRVTIGSETTSYEITYSECQAVRFSQIGNSSHVSLGNATPILAPQNIVQITDDKEIEEKNSNPRANLDADAGNNLICITKDFDADCSLKVYHTKGFLTFRCFSVEERKQWLGEIRATIQQNTTEEDWRSKEATFTDLLRLKRDVLPESSLRYASLLHSLNNSGFYVESPLTSKLVGENSSVVQCESPPNSGSWISYFVILDGKTLVYYENPQSARPCGVFKLRYTGALVECDQLMKGEFLLRLISPSQQLRLKFKHIVHLAEFVSRVHWNLNSTVLPKESNIPKIIFTVMDVSFVVDLIDF
jgi:hypothetical protein